MKYASLLLFFSGVAILFLTLSENNFFGPDTETTSEFSPVSNLRSLDVETGEVSYKLIYDQKENSWSYLRDGEKLTIDAPEAIKLLQLLNAVVIQYTDKESSAEISESLKNPVITLSATFTDGSTKIIRAAGEGFFKGFLYASVNGKNSVGLLPENVVAAFKQLLLLTAEEKPFSLQEVQTAEEISITTPGRELTLRRDKEWKVATLPELPVAEGRVQEFLQYFKTLTPVAASWSRPEAEVPVEATICFNSETCIEVVSGEYCSGIRIKGSPRIYQADPKKQPLPAMTTSVFLDRLPLKELPEVNSLRISRSESSFLLEKKDNSWMLNGKKADGRFVEGWLKRFKNLEVYRYPAEGINFVRGQKLQDITINDSITFTLSNASALKGDAISGVMECSLAICPFLLDSLQLKSAVVAEETFMISADMVSTGDPPPVN